MDPLTTEHPRTLDNPTDQHRESLPEVRMEVVQAVPVAVTSAYPSLLPGPFILFLLLPAIPLLLFSVGARPPDSSHLPFSTDDIWQTTAFVTVAGAVVLCVGLYPGALKDVGNWVADGGGSGLSTWFRGETTGPPPPPRQPTYPQPKSRDPYNYRAEPRMGMGTPGQPYPQMRPPPGMQRPPTSFRDTNAAFQPPGRSGESTRTNS